MGLGAVPACLWAWGPVCLFPCACVIYMCICYRYVKALARY